MNSTAIECKLIRAGGTRVTIENTEYHFAPYTDGAHVCEVADEEHADRFLSIREGYRLYRGESKPVAATVAAIKAVLKPESVIAAALAPAPVVMDICTNLFEPEYTIHGTTYTLADVAQAARETIGYTVWDWNAMTDIERSDAIEAELTRIDAAGPVPAPTEPTKAEVDADIRASLAAEYERLYGKKPHHNTGIDKLRELIAAKQ